MYKKRKSTTTRKRRNYRRRTMYKPKTMRSAGANYAKLVETTQQQILTEIGGNQVFSLSECQRAQEVAHSYKFYRLKKVDIDFLPYANIAAVGAGANAKMLQLYAKVDRVCNQNIALTEAEALERGIRPKLFKSKISYTFKPNLLQIVQLEVNQPADGGGRPLGVNAVNAQNSIPIYNKWLPTQQSFGYNPGPTPQLGLTINQNSTNPYALNYYGFIFVITSDGGTPLPAGDLQIRLHWEFKGARALTTLSPNPITDAEPVTSSTAGAVPNTQPTNYP